VSTAERRDPGEHTATTGRRHHEPLAGRASQPKRKHPVGLNFGGGYAAEILAVHIWR
jgi:hypothetical protein